MSEHQGKSSLISDSVTVKTLRDFLASPKPAGMTPVDVLHVIQLTLRKAEDHPIYDSQQTLARAFCCDDKTIVRSQKRLEKLKWLSRPQRKGRTNALSLNHENIPTETSLRTLVTADAKKLAAIYQRALMKAGRKRFPKFWLGQQFLSAQRILDRCDGDVQIAADIVTYALHARLYRARAMKSLYTVLGAFPKIAAAYLAQHEQKQRELAIQAQADSGIAQIIGAA
jgi:hypothetical protein